MKKSVSEISKDLINKFDTELLMLIKEDIQIQSQKVRNRIINMNTIMFDNELYQIIKQDIQIIKEQLSSQQRNLAKAS